MNRQRDREKSRSVCKLCHHRHPWWRRAQGNALCLACRCSTEINTYIYRLPHEGAHTCLHKIIKKQRDAKLNFWKFDEASSANRIQWSTLHSAWSRCALCGQKAAPWTRCTPIFRHLDAMLSIYSIKRNRFYTPLVQTAIIIIVCSCGCRSVKKCELQSSVT